ncbi:hypothetical protein AAG906_003138 [Vitis piasezkii]
MPSSMQTTVKNSTDSYPPLKKGRGPTRENLLHYNSEKWSAIPAMDTQPLVDRLLKRDTINSENREKLPFNHRGGSKPFAFHRQDNSMSVATGELQGKWSYFMPLITMKEEMRKLQEQSTQDGDTAISTWR